MPKSTYQTSAFPCVDGPRLKDSLTCGPSPHGGAEAAPYSHSTHRFQHNKLQETLNIVLVSGDFTHLRLLCVPEPLLGRVGCLSGSTYCCSNLGCACEDVNLL